MRRGNALRDTARSPARMVKQGKAFLRGVDMAYIESLHAGSTYYKVRCMLQAVILRKQCCSVRQISKILRVAKVPSMNGCGVWLSAASNAYATPRILEGRAASLFSKKTPMLKHPGATTRGFHSASDPRL